MNNTSYPIPNTPLPTLDRLGASVLAELDAKKISTKWFNAFSAAVVSRNIQDFSTLFVLDAFWRDILALTWDFRTFSGLTAISKFIYDCVGIVKPTAFKLHDDGLGLQKLFPDLAWIHFTFDFETETGVGYGIGRLIPTANGEWKAYSLFTHLEGLKGIPERIGSMRDSILHHGKWADLRIREKEFLDANEKQREPAVVIIGAGRNGLELAARLKAYNVPTLVVERNARIGDNWRNRYESLCLHDPVYFNHMAYVPFPSTFPVHTPSQKIPNWLEFYPEILELNVWTSSTVVSVVRDTADTKWSINIKLKDGTERTFQAVRHVVFATGLGDGLHLPLYSGMDRFKGEMVHSTRHTTASDYKGKKVVVVGSFTSDCYEHDVDVTMYQRGSTHVLSAKNGWNVLFSGIYSENAPPTDIADRLMASVPNHMVVGIAQRSTKLIAKLDKDLLDGLRMRGFKLNDGPLGTGLRLLVWGRLGGYYIDTGGSQLIVDGKIKLKSGPLIERFTERAIEFDDGSELEADVVVFATGLCDRREHIRRVCGEDVAQKCKPIGGYNKEGEIYGAWRDVGMRGLWYMFGNFAFGRFHSKHIALQIKAMEEGVFGERYSADE